MNKRSTRISPARNKCRKYAREYPAGGFWADDDLQALVWQLREAEILQAVHRARPVHRPVPIFLLCNLPLDRAGVDEHPTGGRGGKGEGDDQAQPASAPLRGVGAHELLLASRQGR